MLLRGMKIKNMILHKVEIRSGRFVLNLPYAQNNSGKNRTRLVKNYYWRNWSADIIDRQIHVKGPNKGVYPLMDGVLIFYSVNINGNSFYFSKLLEQPVQRFLEKFNISDFVKTDPNKEYETNNLFTDGKIEDDLKFGKRCICVTDASFVLEPVMEEGGNSSFILFSNNYPTVLEERLEGILEVK